jgi:CHAT domain-containing protein/Tfp pilus assembly protein PilF
MTGKSGNLRRYDFGLLHCASADMYLLATRAGCLILFVGVAIAQSPVAKPTAHDLLTRGKQLYLQQGPKAALPQFEEALQTFRSNKDRFSEAITLGYIANCQRKLENLDQALELADQALHIKEELGDHDEIGKTHNQLGLIYWERADYSPAIQHFQKAIEIASTIPDKELEGSAHNNLGLVFDERGEYTHSLEHYQRALELHQASHFERGEGDTLGNIGGIYLLLGKFREALPYYRRALEISDRLGLKPASSDDLGNIALCLAGTGDIDEALATYDRALQVARETSLTKEEADWHRGKGTIFVGLGRYDAALREYAAAEQVYERSRLQRELVEGLNDAGGVYELLGDTAAAETRFNRALHLAQTIGNTSGETATLLALGELERGRHRNDRADTYFGKALQSARAAGDEGTTVAALLARATNAIATNRYEPALEDATEASQRAKESGNLSGLAHSNYVIAEARRSQKEFQKALDAYAAAEALQKQIRDPELGWKLLYGRGQSFQETGNTDSAIAAYESAVQIIESTRAEISEERYRAGYLNDRYRVYVSLVELLLKLRRSAQAFLYSEKLRGRAYLDQLGTTAPASSASPTQQRIGELQEQIQRLRRAVQKEYALPQRQRRAQALDVYSSELSKAERDFEAVLDDSRGSKPRSKQDLESAPSAAEIQRLLATDTAIIEYVVGLNSLDVLLITKTLVTGLSVPITPEGLSSRTELLRDLIMQRSSEWTGPAKSLVKVLLTPVQTAGYLAGIRKLLIVPDGVLNYVPFAALPLDNRGLLGDQFAVAYLPSAMALVTQSHESGMGKALLAMAPSAPALPNTAAEVRSIGELFPNTSRVVAGKAATETLFKQVAGNYQYLHLATHGSLNRNAPSLSTLELEPDMQNDGRLELHEIMEMKLHARLVTLSACETALGRGYFAEIPPGNEFVGMTRAFLNAGGDHVLASLWPVNDLSTRVLMVAFYRHLRQMGAAEALARAQRELRRSDERYRAPYYWAAFVMVGPPN